MRAIIEPKAANTRRRAGLIYGDHRIHTGMLSNEIYIGRVIWNRAQSVKDPDTNRRKRIAKPRDEWVNPAADQRRDALLLRLLKTPPQPRPKRERPKKKSKKPADSLAGADTGRDVDSSGCCYRSNRPDLGRGSSELLGAHAGIQQGSKSSDPDLTASPARINGCLQYGSGSLTEVWSN